MADVPVFAAERDAGVAEKVWAGTSVAYATAARLGDGPVRPRTPRRAPSRVRAAGGGQPDLHYLTTLMVSTVWNKNDDVFAPAETWAARRSPEDKPFNYEHVEDDIIGHITACVAVGPDHKPLPDDAAVDDLPSPFHILTQAVLYKFWDDDALQDRMDKVIAEIAEGKWYVSMEASFNGFDYAVRDDDGTHRVVSRNEKTAFLTKHLRAYGGSGTYQKKPVGRVLRNVVFTGKGLVRQPANEASVIFADCGPFKAAAGEIILPDAELGYGTAGTRNTQESSMAAENELTAKLDEQKAKNKALREENETLKASLKQVDDEKVKSLQADLVARDGNVTKLASELAASDEKVKAAEASAAEWKAKFEASDAEAKSARAELDTAKAERRKADRVAALKAALGCDDAKASEMAERLAGLDDEAFKAHADYMSEKLAEYKKTTPTSTDDGETPKTPPKATEAKLPPPVKPSGQEPEVNLPTLPQPGKKDTIAGEQFVPGPASPALNSAPAEDEAVGKVRADVAAYMGQLFDLADEDRE